MTEAQFSEEYLKHSHRLVRFIVSRGCDEEAEDIASTVWLRAWRFRHSFRGKAKFSSWLFRIAINEIREQYRSAHLLKRAATIVELTPVLCDQISAQQSLESQVHSKLELARIVRRLPVDTMELYKLVYVFGFEYHEIAEDQGVNLRTLKTRVRRLREKV